MSVHNTLVVKSVKHTVFLLNTRGSNPEYDRFTIDNVLQQMNRFFQFPEETVYTIQDYYKMAMGDVLKTISPQDLGIINVVFDLFSAYVESPNLYNVAETLFKDDDHVEEVWIIPEDYPSDVNYDEVTNTAYIPDGQKDIGTVQIQCHEFFDRRII